MIKSLYVNELHYVLLLMFSDDELKSKSKKSHSVSEKATTRSARSRASKLAPDSCESDLSSLMDDESRRDPLSQASKVCLMRRDLPI